jgi:hypothetical protein
MNPLASWPKPDESRRDAQALYGRFLAHWACDLLAIRRAGLDVPAWRNSNSSDQRVLRKAA